MQNKNGRLKVDFACESVSNAYLSWAEVLLSSSEGFEIADSADFPNRLDEPVLVVVKPESRRRSAQVCSVLVIRTSLPCPFVAGFEFPVTGCPMRYRIKLQT